VPGRETAPGFFAGASPEIEAESFASAAKPRASLLAHADENQRPPDGGLFSCPAQTGAPMPFDPSFGAGNPWWPNSGPLEAQLI
jgi:hypothetical protein